LRSVIDPDKKNPRSGVNVVVNGEYFLMALPWLHPAFGMDENLLDRGPESS
jgi:hypothetical protein